jgi:hypothetical protein
MRPLESLGGFLIVTQRESGEIGCGRKHCGRNRPVRRQIKRNFMKTSDLVFVGIKGSVVALDRATGLQVWATHLKGSDFVNVVLENGAILATCHGEIYCLDPLTGNGRWHNPLKGFGTGLATIATDPDVCRRNAPVLAEKRRHDQQAAQAAAAAAAAA